MERQATSRYYQLLGVDRDASLGEIRRAYLARARAVHPDRLDRQAQPSAWQRANHLLAELNQAYAELSKSARHGSSGSHLGDAGPKAPAPPRTKRLISPGAVDDLTEGEATFASLGSTAQHKLLRRQRGTSQQLRVATASCRGHYAALATATLWTAFLAVDAFGPRWGMTLLAVYGTISLLVFALAGHGLIELVRWHGSKLRPFFYLTPLYVIQTALDQVRFWPIWRLRGVSIVHDGRTRRKRTRPRLCLELPGTTAEVPLPSQQDAERFCDLLATFQHRLREAREGDLLQYLLRHDDFRGVPRAPIANPDSVRPTKGHFVVALLALVGLLVIGGARHLNRTVGSEAVAGDRSQAHAYRGPGESAAIRPQARVNEAFASAPRETDLEPPTLPTSGVRETYLAEEPTAPLAVVARDSSRHFLVTVTHWDSGSAVLTIFVRAGDQVEAELPLGAYRVKYAAGMTWYGEEQLFGPRTRFGEVESRLDFERDGHEARGFTIELGVDPGGETPR